MAKSWEELIEETNWEKRSLETIPDWFLKDIIEDTKEGKVLNIASGDGSIEKLIGGTVVSGDINEDRVSGTKIPVQVDAENLPFQTECFDAVVSIETVEHLDNPEKFVGEVYRVLKPNSKCYIKTPNKVAHDIFQISNGHLDRRKDIHPSIFTPNTFRNTFDRFPELNLYDADLMDYQKEKITTVNSTIGGVISRIPFKKLPKILQPSIIAVAKK
jgi:SAM-dependent methyltransferase